jgi:hypothetical protein
MQGKEPIKDFERINSTGHEAGIARGRIGSR